MDLRVYSLEPPSSGKTSNDIGPKMSMKQIQNKRWYGCIELANNGT